MKGRGSIKLFKEKFLQLQRIDGSTKLEDFISLSYHNNLQISIDFNSYSVIMDSFNIALKH